MSQQGKTSFRAYTFCGMALDPIHVGTGGSRLGRVDNTIVRDPVTRIPKVPGSSLAGVVRAYAAMAEERYPRCAGQGLARDDQGPTKDDQGHCGQSNCPICTVFGFATGLDGGGGFAGLAAFSDMQVLLFPVPSASGPLWVTSPLALEHLAPHCLGPLEPLPDPAACYRLGDRLPQNRDRVNLGWLMLPLQPGDELKSSDQDNGQKVQDKVKEILETLGVDPRIRGRVVLVSDQVFTQVVNSNLEVRTSVAIDPATGAALEGALFTYEALPRTTILVWEVICRHPAHFKMGEAKITAVESPEHVCEVVTKANHYLEYLGIGGMGRRGMGRLRVLGREKCAPQAETNRNSAERSQGEGQA